MKLSVSLPQGDVEFLDALVEEAAADSRSAALHQAMRVLEGIPLSL
jgi:Arc/MetJ-type ribon-helix-helix transcriptional regulator